MGDIIMKGFYCSAVQIDLRESTNEYFNITDAPYDIILDGHVYRAVGSLLAIDKITTENTISSKSLGITLCGVSAEFQETVNTSLFKRAPITIKKCFVPDGDNKVTAATIYYLGFTSTPETDVDYNNGSMALKVDCKSIFDLDKTPSLMRANNATHQALHNGDKFFQYSNTDRDADVMWRQ